MNNGKGRRVATKWQKIYNSAWIMNLWGEKETWTENGHLTKDSSNFYRNVRPAHHHQEARDWILLLPGRPLQRHRGHDSHKEHADAVHHTDDSFHILLISKINSILRMGVKCSGMNRQCVSIWIMCCVSKRRFSTGWGGHLFWRFC